MEILKDLSGYLIIILFILSCLLFLATCVIFFNKNHFHRNLNIKIFFIFLAPFFFGFLMFLPQNLFENKASKASNNNEEDDIKERKIQTKKIKDNAYFSQEIIDYYDIYNEIDTANEEIVQKNANITTILKPHGISDIKIWELENYLNKKDIFNVKKGIRPGKKYALFFETDSLKKLKYFAYEINKEKYLFVDFSDSIYAHLNIRKAKIETKHIAGIIHSSLWIALKADLSTNLEIDAIVDQLTEKIYPWTINFYKLYPEDRFKLIYDAKYINGEFVCVEKVHASLFLHNGKDYYAFSFGENDTIYEYYDEDGNNLRKFFLTAPVSYKRISSKYSPARKHPVTGKIKSHKGTDFAAESGSPIYATADGIIEHAKYTSANGYYVKIRHNNTYSTQYLHMNKKSRDFWKKNNIKAGQKIKQKDVIGYVGSTGLATGPHVCYRFWKNGEQVDPFKCSLPPSEPINNHYITEYNLEQSKWMLQLDSILYEDEIRNTNPIEVSSLHFP